ncbi:MAG: 23S rRNA (adenine(2030)-N(6))-methyltransferase RlmJ [Opitutae bacterium]|nr:23S rRNA (adenine(2030)-N(6))-methyltransferase RlmJ [Opitutae bacterium]
MAEDFAGLDEIGDWSVDKLRILRDYSERYSLILQNQRNQRGAKQFFTGYIDAFAGAGEHVHKTSGAIVKGSPLIALELPHRFDHYEFIDLNPERVGRLIRLAQRWSNVSVHQGDCNDVLLKAVLPKYRYDDYRRALCFLDPYCLQLDWKVMETAGRMRSIEIFLNFPIHDMNRNAKRKSIEDVDPKSWTNMTKFWGDESWHPAMFAPSRQADFFAALGGGEGPELEKVGNDSFAGAFQKRLKDVAGFKYVPDPVPMKNSIGAVVYYLFFASNNDTGARIANAIMKGYR